MKCLDFEICVYCSWQHFSNRIVQTFVKQIVKHKKTKSRTVMACTKGMDIVTQYRCDLIYGRQWRISLKIDNR